jgi:hypothetical protein
MSESIADASHTKTSSITLIVSKSGKVTLKESLDFDGVAAGYIKDGKLHLIGIADDNEVVNYKLDYKGKVTSGSFTIKEGIYSEVISLPAVKQSTDQTATTATAHEAHSSITVTVNANDKVTVKESAHFDGSIAGYIKNDKLHLVGIADENEVLSYKLDYKGKVKSGSFTIKEGTYSEAIALPKHTAPASDSVSEWSIGQSLTAPQAATSMPETLAPGIRPSPAVSALFDGAFGAPSENTSAHPATPASTLIAAAADTHHGLLKAG